MADFQKLNLIMGDKDVITIQMNLHYLVDQELKSGNLMMADVYLKQLLISNGFTQNKYQVMMRALPLLLKSNRIPESYAQFFIDAFYQRNEDDNWQDDEQREIEEFFNYKRAQNYVTFSQPLPDHLQKQL